MKQIKKLITTLLILLAITSCNKQKQNAHVNTSENNETETNVSENTTAEATNENQNLQTEDNNVPDKPMTIIPGKNGQPDEADIASEHKSTLKDRYLPRKSSDGKYYIYDNAEYYYTYERYCMPVEGNRKDLNLIMLKEDSALYNPDDMGENEKDRCYPGCEFVPLARSKEPVSFNEQTSYWFKVTEKTWVPGAAVYIQTGAFEKLPVEDIKIGMSYEKIENGAWFVVKTKDGSSLTLRDSSDNKTGKVILELKQGMWIYADSQTISTETIDGIEARWYKTAFPKKGYVFGGYLEKQEGVYGLDFASMTTSSYLHDDSKDYMFKIYSAPSVKSEYLGEYEIKPGKYGYQTTIETKEMETIDGVRGLWIYINEPVKGFIFGDKFIYK